MLDLAPRLVVPLGTENDYFGSNYDAIIIKFEIRK